MDDNIKLLVAKQKIIHRYRCSECKDIFSNIDDMVFDINVNKVYCYRCKGYSAPLQTIPKPYASPPSETELHPTHLGNFF